MAARATPTPSSGIRRQRFYDPRRAMAIRAWTDGDLRLAMRLLQWASPQSAPMGLQAA